MENHAHETKLSLEIGLRETKSSLEWARTDKAQKMGLDRKFRGLSVKERWSSGWSPKYGEE